MSGEVGAAVLRRWMWLAVTAVGVLCGWALATPAAKAVGCPNEDVRLGPSASLPDCRAYELVSPPDTDGRLLAPISSSGWISSWDLFPTELASPGGESVVYMTYASPQREPANSSGFFDVYRMQRSLQSWELGRRLTPSGDQSLTTYPGGVSADGDYAFVNPAQATETPGSLGAKTKTSYLSKPDGTFEFTGKGSLGSEPYAQGRYISEDGEHVLFSTGTDSSWCVAVAECKVHPLETNAPPEGTGAVYDRGTDGPTHVVSLLPGNKAQLAGQQAFYKGTSKQASSVAFVIEGTLYVRVHNGEGLSEESIKAAEGNPTYAGLSEDGRYLFYVAGGESGTIHRFDTTDESDEEINPTAKGEIVNVSADGSHVYFISKEQIGGHGVVGEPNLFVWSGSTPVYIATVAPSDLERTSGTEPNIPALTRWTSYAVAPQFNTGKGFMGPGADSSRSTPDGRFLVFESRAQLTGYDNNGHTEIYRWDDQGEDLVCVSCNPSEQPASQDAHLQELVLAEAPIVLHNLSDDGSRVFFETKEALVAQDVDGVNDIYEWQEGEGDPLIHLISSGESVGNALELPPHFPRPNVLFSVTPSGDDVVFLSEDSLVPGAGVGGVPAVYDARVGGGFPVPPSPVPCVEEGCRTAPAAGPPALSSSQSETTFGAGNLKPRKRHHKRRCRKAKHSGSGHRRCKEGKKGGARSSASVARQLAIESGERAPVESPGAGGAGGEANAKDSVPATSPVASAGGSFEEFGIESVAADLSTASAALHPDFVTKLALNHFFEGTVPAAAARMENTIVRLPSGLLGNPNAVPRCTTGELVGFECPTDAQVGITNLLVAGFGKFVEPVYNMEVPHPEREVARFGFIGDLFPVFIEVKVRTGSDYGVTATVEDAPGLTGLLSAETILWGNPADSSHDELRLTAGESQLGCTTACFAPGGKRPSGIPPAERKAFVTNPSACQEGQVGFAVTSYQLPGQVFEKSASLPPITDCTGIPFAPEFEAEPTTHVAGAATGLKTKLIVPQHLGPEEAATATMREARVTLPAGMQIAAGAANWIDTCSAQEVGLEEEVDVSCPDASKLGTATIHSPALREPIEGTLYQRTPAPGRQFGLWLASDALGLHIKLPGELQPDKSTGRLTAVFSDLPQVPVEEIDLNVWGGPRAPLQNPDRCGTYTTDFAFAPHSDDPAVAGQSTMRIDEGCNQDFSPVLHAGVTNPIAGAFSPFVFDLTREDGQQALRGFELHLPDGELAKLAGVPLCGEDAAASGSCPDASRIGSLTAASGPGTDPLWLPQPGKPAPQIFLAGPYQGAPFSIVSEVPAQAGPFDLGTVVVRSGLEVDPETARATVKADPLPQFFEGVGIAYRHLHAVVDRPGFSLNPTDCRETAITSDVTSTQGTAAHPAVRFQVDGCKSLKFKPKLALKLKGGTKRGDYPALTAVLKARAGDANIARTSVGLPHSEFLAQEHIVTICTRKQFAAGTCPKGSVYGKAKAWTPLLDQPLEGPVYLRSSDNPLPDLVVALGGQLEIDLVGRIDSHHGGIRTTFEQVPDAPVSKFVLKMKGGAKGLLVNSTDICRAAHRAAVAMKAQNGRARNLQPPLRSGACGRKK